MEAHANIPRPPPWAGPQLAGNSQSQPDQIHSTDALQQTVVGTKWSY
jgi:hypothetical protein